MRIPFHSLAIAVSNLGFCLFYITSAVLYPGGTWEDASTIGYSFWRNYLCDALQEAALNGLPNPGSRYGLIAFGFLVTTLFFLGGLLAKFLAEYSPKLSKMVLVASFLSMMGVLGVVVFPAEEALRGYHFVAVLTATISGLFAKILPLVCFLKMPTYRSLGKLGLLFLSPAIIAFCYYTVCHLEMLRPQNESLIIGLQKIATIATLMLCFFAIRSQTQIITAKGGDY